MGSYLSIENNTPNQWACRLGPDEAAVNIAKIAATAVAAVGFTVATAGVGGAAFGVARLVISGATLTTSVQLISTHYIAEELKKQGYKFIEPGQKNKWGKMTLSLWQQGTCVRTEITGENTATIHTLYMRPIFSGATDKSERVHSIQWWIDKWGTEKQMVVVKGAKPPTQAPTMAQTRAQQPSTASPVPSRQAPIVKKPAGSGTKYVSIDQGVRQAEMDIWCQQNCEMGNCPPSICKAA